MCSLADKEQPSLDSMITMLSLSIGHRESVTLDDIRHAAFGCPACMLALIRQYITPNHLDIDMVVGTHAVRLSDVGEFDYKAESKKFLDNLAPEENYYSR